MHEWNLTRALVKEIERLAVQQRSTRVVGARIRISSLAAISPDLLREQFSIAAKGGVADGAFLEIEISDGLDNGEARSAVIESLDFGE